MYEPPYHTHAESQARKSSWAGLWLAAWSLAGRATTTEGNIGPDAMLTLLWVCISGPGGPSTRRGTSPCHVPVRPSVMEVAVHVEEACWPRGRSGGTL